MGGGVEQAAGAAADQESASLREAMDQAECRAWHHLSPEGYFPPQDSWFHLFLMSSLRLRSQKKRAVQTAVSSKLGQVEETAHTQLSPVFLFEEISFKLWARLFSPWDGGPLRWSLNLKCSRAQRRRAGLRTSGRNGMWLLGCWKECVAWGEGIEQILGSHFKRCCFALLLEIYLLAWHTMSG